VRYSF